MLVLIENIQPPHIPCSNLLRDAPLATTVTWYDVGVLSHSCKSIGSTFSHMTFPLFSLYESCDVLLSQFYIGKGLW